MYVHSYINIYLDFQMRKGGVNLATTQEEEGEEPDEDDDEDLNDMVLDKVNLCALRVCVCVRT